MNYDSNTIGLSTIKKTVDDIFDEVVSIRRQIHHNPELSEHEKDTSRLVCDELSKLGIHYEDHIAGYGVCGTIYGQNHESAIGIRADMDALPIEEKVDVSFKSKNHGVMHACGHDMHTAILLGTAKVLNTVKDRLPYSVKLFFQPSEETIGGARQMIEAGCLDSPKVEHVIGLHVAPEIESGCVQFTRGAMNAASCEFYVTVKGISCHGAHPSMGLDPLIPACEMVMALQSVITRNLDPTDSALITIGQFHSGTKDNIIPSETKFSGIIRTLKNDQRPYIKELISQKLNGIAAAYGTSCTIDFKDSYPSLVNDDDLYELMLSASKEALGNEKIKINKIPSLGCDDFAYFCHSSKGLYYNLGTAAACVPAAPIHSDLFCPDENAIKTGILTEVWGVLKIMEALKKK